MSNIYNDDLIPQEDIYINYKDIAKVRISKFGSGSKPLFLIPGILSPGLQYKFILRNFLDSGFCFYSIDLPGWIGKSEILNLSKLLKTKHSEIIDYGISELGLGNLDIVGFSYGGSIALEVKNKKTLTLVSPIFNSNFYRNLRYIRAVRALKHFDFGNYIEKRFIDRYKKISESGLKNQMTEKSFEMYRDLYSGINSKVLSRDLSNILKLDLKDQFNKLENVIYVYSKKEKPIFKKHHDYVLGLNKFRTIEYKGNHNDFALKPEEDVIEKILEI